MNREDLIRMALEAGMQANVSKDAVNALGNSVPVQWLDRFAELVAEADRRKHQADIEHWKAKAAQAKKWRGMAHARHCDSEKVVQEIQREAMELERDAWPNLQPVIDWLENGCDPKEAAKELRLHSDAIRARSKP